MKEQKKSSSSSSTTVLLMNDAGQPQLQVQVLKSCCRRTNCNLSQSTTLSQGSRLLFMPITCLCIMSWMILGMFNFPNRTYYRRNPITIIAGKLIQLSMRSKVLLVADSLYVGCIHRCHAYSHPITTTTTTAARHRVVVTIPRSSSSRGQQGGGTPPFATRSRSSSSSSSTSLFNSGGTSSSSSTEESALPPPVTNLVPGLISTSQMITSKASSTVKLFSNLVSSSKMRRQYNLTVVEGYRLVLDILENPSTAHLLQHILVTEEALYRHDEFSPILQRHLLHQLQRKNSTNNARYSSPLRVHLVSDNVLTACTDTVTPQGVVATCRIPNPFDPVTYVQNHILPLRGTIQTPPPPSHLFLVLDAISDPGNMGTLIRSSVACGISAIFLLNGCVDPYSSKALRSAMGGTFRIPLQTFSTVQECWDVLFHCGVPNERIFAATSETMSQGDSTIERGQSSTQPSFSSPIHTDIDWIVPPNPTTTTTDQHNSSAIIIGSEGSGLRSEIRNAVTKGQIKSVHVAMEGGLESLNAAICGSVIMFEYARQKREYTRGTNKET